MITIKILDAGLVMNETVLSTGRIPKRQQIVEWAAQDVV